MMKKTIVIALAAFLLSSCKNFYHSSCPGFAGENPEARDGIRSVIETCN
ncbi:lipoprotein [Acetobacter indonesiensis]|nr:lipoprotein [Acetobacter indonesiensis]MCG0993821.1 lipoprotein [Acetobacter indonesiensis]